MVGYSRLRISLPVFVAQEEGFFKEQGLDATLVMYDTAQPLMQALVEGKIDLGGYTALPITYNGMLRSETKLLFVTTMIEDKEHRISYLLRPVPQEDVEPDIKSVQDLQGKTIGILPTIAYKAWLEEIVRRNGLDPGRDIQIRPIAPAQQGLTLKSGGVDALFTNDPAATSAIQAGVAELVTPDLVEVPQYLGAPFAFGSFNVRKEWATTSQDLYQRVVRALNDAVDFVNRNPTEAKLAMKRYLPDQFKNDVEHYPNARYLRTGESSPAKFDESAKLYYDLGIIPSGLNVAELVETKEY